ncbi:MAG: hypothetical protein J6P90_05060 [Rikenellaceae bacterium]|nr:hypothetical protein [Rikenellaceae bacterium]
MMKLLTRYILLLFTACSLLISSCGKLSNDKEKVTPQTIIVYLSGTSLNWAFNINVQDIETALQQNIKGDSRVVVVWQNGVAKKAEAIELCYDNGHITRQPLAEYDLSNTMSKDDLSYIFNDVMRLAPASAYGLVIGSHSWAWIPFDDYDQIRSNGLSKSAYARLRIMDELPRHLQTRFIGDPNGANCFDITTLAEAIQATGKQFEYIIFDACFMANVEAAYELRNSTKYIIGSACEIMGNGFPYAKTLPHLLKNGGRSYDLAEAARSYHEHYKNTLKYSGTIALVNCSQLDALAMTMKEVNKSLSEEYDRNSLQTYEGGTNHIFFDLGDYVDKVCTSNEAKSKFKAQLEKCVPTKFTLDTFWSTYIHSDHYPITSFSGMSTSAPSILFRDSYAQTSWYKATH